jgi:imidazolonepropionase-like amidohydrolase
LAQTKKGTYVLTNARIETVTNGVIERGTLVIRDGKIDAVGTTVALPSDAEKIDCSGLTIYPGMIDAGTQLGLVEVGSLPETRDNSELGQFNPQIQALTAVNPNSVEIPVTRVNGVTTALTAPEGGLFPGTAALINLLGYTPEQMYAGFKGVVMNFPATGRRGPWDDRTDEVIEKAVKKDQERLKNVWEQAVLYAKIDSAYQAKPESARTPEYVPEVQALAQVVRRELPLLIEVNAARDIDSAIAWVQRNKVRAIFTGVEEGWRVADKIAAAGIPCIVGPVLTLPNRPSDRYDKPYANPGLLRAAGVKIAIRTTESANVRNLPYHAGFAAAYGLGREEALRAVTIAPAEIFGVADRLGSLEAGKQATLFVADGDPFEPATNVRHVFIDGYRVPMESRHVELYREFLNREPGLRK